MTTATIDRSPADARTPRSAFRYVATGARILMGLVFFVFGLNGPAVRRARRGAPLRAVRDPAPVAGLRLRRGRRILPGEPGLQLVRRHDDRACETVALTSLARLDPNVAARRSAGLIL